MIKEGHLEIYDVTLTVETPVFIGSGKTINKKEYAYDEAKKLVSIIDMQKLIKCLVDKELIDEYERLILGNAYNGGMNEFLSTCFSKEEIEMLTLYQCNVKGVFNDQKPHNDICQFMRLNDGRPYIPGSSLKGALRTCLLAYLVNDSKLSDDIFDNFLKIVYQKGRRVIDTKFTTDADKKMNEAVFNTLNLDIKHKYNAVNSIMRSISISDSESVDFKHMTICNKVDIRTSGTTNKPSVLRECIRPGTKIKFKLTIDKSLHGLSIEDVRGAIEKFLKFYNAEYLPHFRLPNNAVSVTAPDNIILGGGSGFFSKTVVYNIYAHDDALDYVSELMEEQFKGHYHESDYDDGISPHTLKYTQYGNSLIPFGMCKFEAE